MKLFLIKLFKLLLVFAFIYPILIAFLGSFWLTQRKFTNNIVFNQGGNSHMWSKLQDADTTKNIDVLILGSSIALRGIDTRVFENYGFKSFNLASNYQTPLQTEYLLDKYLDQFSPRYVIWEVTPITFQNKGLESFIDVFSNTEVDSEAVKQSFEIFNIIAWNALIVNKVRQVFGDFYNYKERNVKGNNRYISGGYVESNNLIFDDREKSLHSYNITFLESQKLIFKNYLMLLKKKNIKVILIHSPTTFEYYSYIKNWEEINSYFKELRDNGLVFDYRNYNELIPEFGRNTNFFSDKMHLNKVGANMYTEFLYNDLSVDFFESK